MVLLALLFLQPQVDAPLRGKAAWTRVAPDFPHPAPDRRVSLHRLLLAGDAETEAAVDRALDRLAAAQGVDGLWTDGAAGDAVPASARVLLAFAGAGYGPHSERHGPAVRRALTRLLEIQEPSGAWGRDVRELALAAAAVAAMYGRHPSPALGEPLARASACLHDRRALDGGWGVEPWARRSDPTVTLWAHLAGRSWHDVLSLSRGGDVPEHEAVLAFFGGRETWRRWLAEARPRLLAPAKGVVATARQALDLATPYRFAPLDRWTNTRTSCPSP